MKRLASIPSLLEFGTKLIIISWWFLELKKDINILDDKDLNIFFFPKPKSIEILRHKVVFVLVRFSLSSKLLENLSYAKLRK